MSENEDRPQLVRRGNNGGALTTSRPPSEEDLTVWLGTQMAMLRAAFPNQELPEGTPDVLLEDWLPLVKSAGMARFEMALTKARRDLDFFPSTAEVKRYLADIPVSHRVTTEPNCPDCGGSGWAKMLTEDRVKRCHCRRVIGQ